MVFANKTQEALMQRVCLKLLLLVVGDIRGKETVNDERGCSEPFVAQCCSGVGETEEVAGKGKVLNWIWCADFRGCSRRWSQKKPDSSELTWGEGSPPRVHSGGMTFANYIHSSLCACVNANGGDSALVVTSMLSCLTCLTAQGPPHLEQTAV